MFENKNIGNEPRNSLAFIIIVNTRKLDERKYSNICSIFQLVETCIFWWQKKALFMFFFSCKCFVAGKSFLCYIGICILMNIVSP